MKLMFDPFCKYVSMLLSYVYKLRVASLSHILGGVQTLQPTLEFLMADVNSYNFSSVILAIALNGVIK